MASGQASVLLPVNTNSADLSPRQAGDKIAQDSLNAFLQIQEQLHTTQLLIESNRVAAAAEAQRNATEMNTRIQVLEQTVATQRASEIEATQKAQRLTLILAGAFGVVGLAAVLFMAYFQWRAVTRLVELSTLHPVGAALWKGEARHRCCRRVKRTTRRGAPPWNFRMRVCSTWSSVWKSGCLNWNTWRARRWREPHRHLADGHNGVPPASADHDRSIASLLTEGQSLLNGNEPEKALECFDQALSLGPEERRDA